MSLAGKSTTKQEIPKYIENASKGLIGLSKDYGSIGYVPYTGPDVAAFSGQQLAGMQGANMAAQAFGLPGGGLMNMPAPQTFAGGMQGYSSAPVYQQAVNQIDPAQYAAMTKNFVQPSGTGGKGGGATAPSYGKMGGM